MECKSTYCECSDMNRLHCDALLTDRYRSKVGERTVGIPRAMALPYGEFREVSIQSLLHEERRAFITALQASQVSFTNRAIHDALARCGLVLDDALPRLSCVRSPNSDTLLLDGRAIVQVKWTWIDDSYQIERTFMNRAVKS